MDKDEVILKLMQTRIWVQETANHCAALLSYGYIYVGFDTNGTLEAMKQCLRAISEAIELLRSEL